MSKSLAHVITILESDRSMPLVDVFANKARAEAAYKQIKVNLTSQGFEHTGRVIDAGGCYDRFNRESDGLEVRTNLDSVRQQ